MQGAVAAFRRAVEVNPHYAAGYNDLGVALESTGDAARAEEAYKTALRLDPELAAAHTNLALLYEESGQLQKAAEHWAARVRMGPPVDGWVAMARQKLTQHNLPVPESAGNLSPARQEKVEKATQSLKKEQANRDQREWAASQSRVRKEADDLRKQELAQKAEAGRLAKETRQEAAAQKKTSKAVQKPSSPPQDALSVAQEYAREKAKTRKTTVRDLNDRAVNAMREGQYQEAADAFNQILILDPGNRDAQRGLERAEKALAKELP